MSSTRCCANVSSSIRSSPRLMNTSAWDRRRRIAKPRRKRPMTRSGPSCGTRPLRRRSSLRARRPNPSIARVVWWASTSAWRSRSIRARKTSSTTKSGLRRSRRRLDSAPAWLRFAETGGRRITAPSWRRSRRPKRRSRSCPSVPARTSASIRRRANGPR